MIGCLMGAGEEMHGGERILFARQVDPSLRARELTVELDMAKFAADLQPYVGAATSPSDMLQRFGQFALDANRGLARRRVGRGDRDQPA